MTVSERFDRLEYVVKLIAVTERRVQTYRDTLCASSAPFDTERVTHSRNMDAMGEKVSAVVDAERDLSSLKEELAELQTTAMYWIGLLTDPQEIQMMTMRYIEGKQNDVIAMESGVGVRRVQMIIREAKNNIEKSLNFA